MPISRAQFEAMQARVEKSNPKPVALEKDLHSFVLDFCNAQWPRWKTVHARMDKKATLPVGCQDFTVFADNGRVFAIECKARNEKPDADQLAWHKEMEMLGHKVHVIRTLKEFIELAKQILNGAVDAK